MSDQSPQQLNLLSEAAQRRDDGIARSANRADRVVNRWTEHAHTLLLVFLNEPGREKFLAETFREWALANGLPTPPDLRAFGGVLQAAHRQGLLAKDGYGPAKSSNLSPKVFWKRAA